MGTQIVAKNVNAESFALKYAAPVRRGLEAWHFLNTDLVKAARNYAPGKPNAKIVGVPTAQSNYMQFKSLSNFLQTEIQETAAMTTFSVVRCLDTLIDDAHRPIFIGTYQSLADDGGLTIGASLYANGLTTISTAAGRGTKSGDAVSILTNHPEHNFASFALIVQEITGGAGTTKMTNATTGVVTSVTSALPRFPSAGLMRIGSGYTRWLGNSEIAFVALYSELLTSAEIAAVVEDIRRYMATRGIIV